MIHGYFKGYPKTLNYIFLLGCQPEINFKVEIVKL